LWGTVPEFALQTPFDRQHSRSHVPPPHVNWSPVHVLSAWQYTVQFPPPPHWNCSLVHVEPTLQFTVQVAPVHVIVPFLQAVAELQLITQVSPGGHVMSPTPVPTKTQSLPMQVPPPAMHVAHAALASPALDPEPPEPTASPVPAAPPPTGSKPMRPHAATITTTSHTRTKQR
jgi:hypothetical protein